VTVKLGKLDVINMKHTLGPIVFGTDDKNLNYISTAVTSNGTEPHLVLKSGKLDVINTKHTLGPTVFGTDDKNLNYISTAVTSNGTQPHLVLVSSISAAIMPPPPTIHLHGMYMDKQCKLK